VLKKKKKIRKFKNSKKKERGKKPKIGPFVRVWDLYD